jgi:hypothetical protein
VDAGGPYNSSPVGQPTQLNGSFDAGTGANLVILWETDEPGGSFSNSAIEDPTYTPAATGNWTLTLNVSNDAGTATPDTASLEAYVPISFDGNIATVTGVVGTPINPIDVSGQWSGTRGRTHSETGVTWPGNADLDAVTAIITWTPVEGDVGNTDGCTATATETSDPFDAAASNQFRFTAALPAAPVITQEPQDQTVAENEPVTFSMAATGATALTYQWYDDVDGTLVGETATDYTNSPPLSENGRRKFCIATDGYDQSTSTRQALQTVQEKVVFSGTIPALNARVGEVFSFDASTYFSGDITPFAYSSLGLPFNGLDINSTTGVISGTPNGTGVDNALVITATDDGGYTADSNSTVLTITEAAVPVSIDGIPNTNGEVNTPFTLNLLSYTTGTETPFSYQVATGTLPGGLSIVGTDITGTPTTVETQTGISIEATDDATNTDTSNLFTIDILAEVIPVKRDSDVPDLSYTLGNSTTYDLSQHFSGTELPFDYTVAGGTLPSWASLNSVTGELTVTPDASENETVIINVVDNGANSASTNAFSISASQVAQNRVYPLQEGSGTVMTEQGGQNGTWTVGTDWSFAPNNSRYYPMDEGTGATLVDTVSGQDGTIQNFSESNWKLLSET